MDENINIAITAIYKLLNIETSVSEDEVNLEQVEELISKLKNNNDVQNLLAEYNLAQSYAFTCISLTDNKKFIEEKVTKAKEYNSEIVPFNHKSFKKDLKRLKLNENYYRNKSMLFLRKKFQKKKKKALDNFPLNLLI